MSLAVPTSEEKDDVLLACRYGDLGDIQSFVHQFGPESLDDIRDEGGNTVLHMVCANGHIGVCLTLCSPTCLLHTELTYARHLIDCLEYLLTTTSPSLLSAQNEAKSTALHWAALNSHLEIAQKLVKHPQGPGVDLIDIKNSAGRSPLGEAENVGWEEGAKWFVEVMNLDEGSKEEEDLRPVGQDIEVEIQDAEGQVAKMKISQPEYVALALSRPQSP